MSWWKLEEEGNERVLVSVCRCVGALAVAPKGTLRACLEV